MSHEVQIIWQTPGTEPFASVQWDDGSPTVILIMVGKSAQKVLMRTVTLTLSHYLMPRHKWLNHIASEAQRPIREMHRILMYGK